VTIVEIIAAYERMMAAFRDGARSVEFQERTITRASPPQEDWNEVLFTVDDGRRFAGLPATMDYILHGRK
jgi:hypothetical protein